MGTYKKFLLGFAVILVLALAWYGISPLFKNVELNEALPENVIETENTKDDTQKVEVRGFDQIQKEPIEGDTSDSSQDEITAPARYPVMGTTGHPASGFIRVLETADGKTIIRYEDFETINGPNLHVYLAKDLNADEYIDLGPIKGTRGNINYEVPDGIDISEYKYVMYWCVPFSVLFNYAEI